MGESIDITLSHQYLMAGEHRRLVLTPRTSSRLLAPTEVVAEVTGDRIVLQLSDQQGALLRVDSQDRIVGNKTTEYELSERRAYAIDSQHYRVEPVVGLELVATTSVHDLCLEMGTACVGYSLVSRELFRSICHSDGTCASTTKPAEESFIMVTHVRLSAGLFYDAEVQDVLIRGCHGCSYDYYPEPEDAVHTPDAVKPCTVYCDPIGSCNSLGNCTKMGLCHCFHDHMNAHCTDCVDTYYPSPANYVDGGPEICSRRCQPDKFMNQLPAPPQDDGPSVGCSGHGVCNTTGYCRCVSGVLGKPNGYDGADCNDACHKDHTSGLVCSGHGRCRDGRCANCDDGWFGTECHVTCNRTDQYFWAENGIGELPCNPHKDDCDLAMECGTVQSPMRCMKRKCNGAGCINVHQYQHGSGTNMKMISYAACNISSALSDIREACTSYDAVEYAEKNMTALTLGQTDGIYCDTLNARTANPADDWQQTHGLCARAECNCLSPRPHTSRVIAKVDIAAAETLIAAMQLGGPGCQYAGCMEGEFGNDNRYRSVCGYLPPRSGTNDPLSILYAPQYAPSDTPWIAGYIVLNETIEIAPQYCSHGDCTGFKANTRAGTQESPAPEFAGGLWGQCQCKQVPKTDPICTSGEPDPGFASSCCNGFDTDDGASLFYGVGCSEHCVCFRDNYHRGTCAVGDSSSSVMGASCNCRAGYSLGGIRSTRNVLFCGPTCRSQCRGIINSKTGNAVSSSFATTDCPSEFAKSTEPPFIAGCYNDLLPCNGRGSCVTEYGACSSPPLVTGSQQLADCTCWGRGITTVNHVALPDEVVLRGGPDCAATCPGTEGLETFVAQHYNALHGTVGNHSTVERDRLLETYAQEYTRLACSGHGYCTSKSHVTDSGELRCSCPGDFGGARCDKVCDIKMANWARNKDDDKPIRPFQEKQIGNKSIAMLNTLAYDFGLNVCGPHSTCGGDNASCTLALEYEAGRYQAWKYYIAREALRSMYSAVTEAKFDNFFEQWAMAFVGDFADCEDGFFSSKPVNQHAQSNNYLEKLPDIVRWELDRSCDTKYESMKWSGSSPWCCKTAEHGTCNVRTGTGTGTCDVQTWQPCTTNANCVGKWHDATVANFQSEGHGGCAEGDCPNFATGKMCKTCVSDAFTGYKIHQGSTKQCDDVANGYQSEGYCTICAKVAGTLPHFVYPTAHAAEDVLRYPVDGERQCEHCITHNRHASGGSNKDSKMVCNGHGTCQGHANTYSERAESWQAIPKYSDNVGIATGHLLLCGSTAEAFNAHQYQLGLCVCEDGYTGPTCAMPTATRSELETQSTTHYSSCNGHGEIEDIAPRGPYADEVQPYKRCVCEPGYYGFYCEGHTSGGYGGGVAESQCQVLEQDAQRTYTLVACNGQATCNDNICVTCKDNALDPFSACREYKAKGTGGIRHAHQLAVAANTGECAFKAQLTARDETDELCWRWSVAKQVKHDEDCPEHTTWIKKCGTDSSGNTDAESGGLYSCSGSAATLIRSYKDVEATLLDKCPELAAARTC